MLGSGIVASQASTTPSGFTPVPAMTRPSSEMPVAARSVQPARSRPQSSTSTFFKGRMPWTWSQRNASNPRIVWLNPTTRAPSADTPQASL